MRRRDFIKVIAASAPFDLFAETIVIAAQQRAKDGDKKARHTVWLPRPDSNQHDIPPA